MVAVAHRAGFQRSQIGTGTRLGIALAPPVLAGEDARQKTCLLLGRAELDDHRSDHVDAERQDPWRAGGGALFVEDVLLDHAPAGAAVLHRPANGQPAALVEQAHPGDLILPVETLAVTAARRDVGRQPVAQKCTHFLAEGLLGGGELDIH
ncbi:hypothetical protein D3C76_508730 [compost metagenome]